MTYKDLNLRPLDFKKGNPIELRILPDGSFFKFKNRKTVWRLDKMEDNKIFYSSYSLNKVSSYGFAEKIEGNTLVTQMLPNKPKIVLSFSGGETSAWMSYFIWTMYKGILDIVVIFANTGEEDERTLQFVKKCADEWGMPIVWLEADINIERGIGVRHTVVNFESATRDISLFDKAVQKYGLFNHAHPKCTQYLKSDPIKSYVRSLGWGTNYYLAIGIRADEIDRVSVNRKKNKIIYPCIEIKPMTKKQINGFWILQPFRLGLKGYEGNCKTCWKKSEKKLIKIAQVTPQYFEGFVFLEKTYSHHVPGDKDTTGWTFPITMFRSHKPATYYLEQAKVLDPIDLKNENDEYEENCEPFTQCGIDN